MVEIRRASDADVDGLVALNKVVQDLHVAAYPRDFKDVVDQAGIRTWFASRLSQSNSVIAVAALNDSLVGYVWFELQHASRRHAPQSKYF